MVTPPSHAKHVLRLLARRYQTLTGDRRRHPDQRSLRPGQPGAVGHHRDRPGHRRRLIGRSRDNPERMSRKLPSRRCAAPVPSRHPQDLSCAIDNRGGDRQANNALWRIATTRMRCDQTTIEYVEKRRAEGKTRREIIRCLRPPGLPTVDRPTLNTRRRRSTLFTPKNPDHSAQAATAVHAHPTRSNWNEASTTTINSPPDTTNGSPHQTRFDQEHHHVRWAVDDSLCWF